jgi:hypothetical protein
VAVVPSVCINASRAAARSARAARFAHTAASRAHARSARAPGRSEAVESPNGSKRKLRLS